MSESIQRLYNWFLKNTFHTTPVEYLKKYVKDELRGQIKDGNHYEQILDELLKKETDKKGVDVLSKDQLLDKFYKYKIQYDNKVTDLKRKYIRYSKTYQEILAQNPELTREKGFSVDPTYDLDLNNIKNEVLENIKQEPTISTSSIRTVNTVDNPINDEVLKSQNFDFLRDTPFLR